MSCFKELAMPVPYIVFHHGACSRFGVARSFVNAVLNYSMRSNRFHVQSRVSYALVYKGILREKKG